MTKGYTCICGEYNEYPAYVHAHWHDRLVHTCKCNRRWEIVEGEATLLSSKNFVKKAASPSYNK
jgi:hypothetical protein